jgi:ParB family transcriptional regulator, chromosome partitioning protein
MARRSGLGKGLGALIPTEVSGSQGSALREVPIARIRPNTLQPRVHFDEEAMSALAASIREVGVLQPVLVRPVGEGTDEYELIAGERRWRAARRAGLQTIPVLVREVSADANSLEQALVENLHREDLGALEEAGAYQQLIDDFGHTHEEVATRVGKSRATVTNTLRLLQLPAGVQRALADGAISAGHARALLGTPDRTLQESLVHRILAEGLTVRQVEDAVRAGEHDEENGAADRVAPPPGTTDGTTKRAVPRRLPEPGLLELEELLSTHLNTRVKVELHNRRGRVVVEFATLEDLERIYRAMVEGARPVPPPAH